MEASEPTAEVEGKLIAPGETHLDRIARLERLGGHRLKRRRTRRLHSIYLDTPDFSLTRHGIGLRLRRDGTHWEATVKWPGNVKGAVHDRQELNVALPAAPEFPFTLSYGPLRTHLVVHTLDRPLNPILATDIRRRHMDVLPASPARGARPVAEIALDQVSLHAPQGHSFATYAEVEIESNGASRKDIRSLTRALRKRFSLAPSERSKLAFGLGLLYADLDLEPAAGRALERGASVATAIRKIVAGELARIAERDPRVRTGEDPAALHDVRVASRRLRAALRSFRVAIPPRLYEELRLELRWLGRCLGAVRDLQVHLGDLERHRGALPASYRGGLAAFRDFLDEERERKSQVLRETLDSQRYFQLLAKLETFAASRPSPDRLPAEAQQPVSTFAAAAVAKTLRRLRRRGLKLGAEATPEALHELRIRAKRARYLLEFLAVFCGKPGKRVIRRIVRVQDLLGGFNDAVVNADLVCNFLDRRQDPALPPSATLALQELAQARLRETAALRARFSRAWAKLVSKKTRRLARRAIENLAGDSQTVQNQSPR